jgi:hypothetical protein
LSTRYPLFEGGAAGLGESLFVFKAIEDTTLKAIVANCACEELSR